MAEWREVKKCRPCNRFMRKRLKMHNSLGPAIFFDDPAKSPLALNKYMQLSVMWECPSCGRLLSVKKNEKSELIPNITSNPQQTRRLK